MERFGNYELVSRINIGGMAEVFRVRKRGEAGFVKESVLKRILPHYSNDEDFTKMFIDEAIIAAKLNHPNIVQVYNFGQIGGVYFIEMELVEGFDLRRVTREGTTRGKPLGRNRAVQIALAAAKGLGYAHQREEGGRPLGIVHRDVSPHNLLLSFSGNVKITDFGIAKAAARATQTSTGVVKGKIAYMAPEQAAGLELDHRADIYATGVCLWEMIAERRMFAGDDIEIAVRVKQGQTPRLEEVAPAAGEALFQIVGKLLERDKDKRYQTMREAERDLAAVLHDLGGSEAAPLDDYLGDIIPAEAMRAFRDQPGTLSSSPPPPSVSTHAVTDPVSAKTRLLDPKIASESLSATPMTTTVEDGSQRTVSASYRPPLAVKRRYLYLAALLGLTVVAGAVMAAWLPRAQKYVPQLRTAEAPALDLPAPAPAPVMPAPTPESAVAGSTDEKNRSPPHRASVERRATKLDDANAAKVMIACPLETNVFQDEVMVRHIKRDNRAQPFFVAPGHHRLLAKAPGGQGFDVSQDFAAGITSYFSCR